MKSEETQRSCIAFQGTHCIAKGALERVATTVKETANRQPDAVFLVFDSETSELVELDLRGSLQDVLERLPVIAGTNKGLESKPQGRGRPKLGVVAREVTLLPRHWDWLNRQPGGASVALRKLVEEARHGSLKQDRARNARESAYRFMAAMAGDLPGFEEASRALFGGDEHRFNGEVAPWPADIRNHVRQLASASFTPKDE